MVSGAFGINVRATKVVPRQLHHHIRQCPIGEGDFVVRPEKTTTAILLFHGFEEWLDTIPDGHSAFFVERLGRECKKFTVFPLVRTFVVHLGKNQIQELPECRVLRHAFVAVDEIVTSLEGTSQSILIAGTNVVSTCMSGVLIVPSAIGQSP